MTEPTLKRVKTVVWFARGGNVAKQGPYASQVEAAKSLITTNGLPIEGAYVWPEEVELDKTNSTYCGAMCDHSSECLLPSGHGGGHETQHNCVFYDSRPTST
jgi:hypothetical protein